jgi:hypothetical protein
VKRNHILDFVWNKLNEAEVIATKRETREHEKAVKAHVMRNCKITGKVISSTKC